MAYEWEYRGRGGHRGGRWEPDRAELRGAGRGWAREREPEGRGSEYGPARSRGSRRGPYYGWGVPIRGMYSYSLEYGNLGGPEWESETIPPYPTPESPYYEGWHWSAAESSFEPRFRGEEPRFETPAYRPGRRRYPGRGPGPVARRRAHPRGYDWTAAPGPFDGWRPEAEPRGAGYPRGWERDRYPGARERRDIGGMRRFGRFGGERPSGYGEEYAWDYW
ncbi:MAG TPA: hypothetical protein VFQ38_24065 [Longimicrobiales bacterium]|nr:hypothetical protein [Longimicrobiales bacterium]